MKRIIWNNRKRIISSVLVMTVSFASINWNAFYAKAEVNSETQTAKKNYSKAKSKQAEKLLNTFLDIFQEDEPETVEKYELVNERTENSTTYQLSNGQKEIVFHGENVRYNDHDGKLMDYDASLKKISATSTLDSAQLESYAYENASGDTKNYIPKNLTEETPVLLTNGKYSVGISPVLAGKDSKNAFGSSQALEKVQTEKETVMNIYEEESKETTTAVYNSSDSSYSLDYISVNNGVKENIVLNEVPEGNIWRFEKKAGEKDTYILSLIADEEYLKSKERVYPVTIDPTISWSSNSNMNDVYVLNGSYADTNFFSSSVTTMCVGRGKQGLARTYLAFPNLDSKISGMSVASAKLTVYETGSNKGEGIQAHRVTQSWDKSTISWNNRANYNTTPLSSFTSTGITGQSSSLI